MTALTLGDRLVYDDEDCTVEAIGAGQVFLRADTGAGYALTPAAALLCQRSTAVPTRAVPIIETMALDGLPEDVREGAIERLGHVQEVLTGFRSGKADQPAPGEPRASFDIVANPRLGDRQKAKAVELGVNPRQVQRWCLTYRERGVAALVDKRRSGYSNPLQGVDDRIIEAIEQLATAETRASTGNRQRFRRRLKRYLAETYGMGEGDLPSDRSLDRYAEYVLKGSYTFGQATTRRSRAVLPPKVFQGFQATRAGQIVIIDGNRLDISAWDPETDQEIAVEAQVAMDAYTTAIIAWRFTPLGPNRADVTMLVADMLNPLEMREHWQDSVRLSALQIPTERLIGIDERLAAASARPIIRPETLLVDNAKINISDATYAACEKAEISVNLAGIQRGTDKGILERAFGTLRTQFCQHARGYKGNNVVNRGDNVANEVLWTIAELEELFAEWTLIHLRTVNRTLSLPCAPDLTVSPIEAYNESIARCGYLPVLCNQDLYFDLLPTKWATIQQGYITVKGLSYVGPAVVGRDHEPSPYSAQKHKWPVKYDPRDVLHVYLQDRDGSWCQLRWLHASDGMQPFGERTVDMARRLRATKGERRSTQAELAAELENLQNFIDIPAHEAAKVRRRRSRDVERGRQVAADRERGGLTAVPANLTEADEAQAADTVAFDLAELTDLPLLGDM